MFDSFDQAAQYVTENGIQLIDLKFCDRGGAGTT
jgi:hypothetical protein